MKRSLQEPMSDEIAVIGYKFTTNGYQQGLGKHGIYLHCLFNA